MTTTDQGPVAPVAATALRPLRLRAVRLDGSFLGDLQASNATVSIPKGAEHLEQQWDNYRNVAKGVTDAQYRATGRTALLEVARKAADHLHRTFGTGPGQREGFCGHPVAELALVELYRTTGEQRYLDQARYFVDAHGRSILAPGNRSAPRISPTGSRSAKPPRPRGRRCRGQSAG